MADRFDVPERQKLSWLRIRTMILLKIEDQAMQLLLLLLMGFGTIPSAHGWAPHNQGTWVQRRSLTTSLEASPIGVILAGAPASGKGTQCARITEVSISSYTHRCYCLAFSSYTSCCHCLAFSLVTELIVTSLIYLGHLMLSWFAYP